MISEYFIRERLDKLYDELARVQIDMEELRDAVFFNNPEYIELCMIQDSLSEKIDLLEWVLGDK